MHRYSETELIFALLSEQTKKNEPIFGEGVLNFTRWFRVLAAPDYNCGPDDICIAFKIRRFGLRTGDTVSGQIRPPKERRYFALLKVETIFEDRSIRRRFFDNLTPLIQTSAS